MASKQKRTRQIALHLAMDASRTKGGPIRVDEVLKDAKLFTKFLTAKS